MKKKGYCLNDVMEALGSITTRLTALEEARGPVPDFYPAGGLQADLKPAKPALPYHRCEVCNEPYQGLLPPVGTPKLCAIHRVPGAKVHRCESCRKPIKAQGICAKCAACVLCGSKQSTQVCLRCIEQDGIQTCQHCLALPRPGSSFCDNCDPTTKMTAAHFDKTQIAEPDPRALAEHQSAVLAAMQDGRTDLVAKLEAQPDLQPALPR